MRSNFPFNAFLASAVPVLGAVIVQSRHSHDIEPLGVLPPSTELEVLNRVRQSSYPRLEKRANGMATLGSFDLGLNITSDILFSV